MNLAAARGSSLIVLACWLSPVAARAARPEAGLQAMVEQDWSRQEQRRGRTAESPQAVGEAIARAARHLERARPRPGSLEATADRDALSEMQRAADRLESLDAPARLALYQRARWFTRRLVLSDPLLAGKPLLFMKRNRFISQMLHEYLGYFYDYGRVEGGGVYVLDRPGLSLELRDLVQGRLPRGNFTTLACSYDARTIYFAFAERAETKPDFYSPQRRSFQVFAVGADGSDLRRLTEGLEDNFDPCPLPDGGIAFLSSRRGGFGRCHNPWEPLPAYTLHRMNTDGTEAETLSWHETNEWHPFVMNDGRLVYIRWDYVDRSAANFHGLWTTHPDGTAAAGLFGNYTMRINACYQPRPIPGSDRILFVAGAHHAVVGGSLVLLDPKRARLDPKSGEDLFEGVEKLTPEVCFPEADGWPKSYFHSPWPLSEDCYLVSFSFDPLPGMNSGETKDTRTGLYYFDRFGNLELLYRDPAISSMYPIPLAPRARPPVIASSREAGLGEMGEFLLTDVRRSFSAMPPGRNIRELRVFQILPKTETHVANEPRIGHANAESARLLLGTVPVEADGSACFQAPARKPLYFQAVDDQGRAVQTMRSAAYLQPGERRGCVGCHETPGSAAANRPVLATRRPPSRLAPGPDGSQPLSFARLVQPVLDRHCVRCHDGGNESGKSKPWLTGEPLKTFSRSYQELKPYLRWYEWGEASISQIASHPGHMGADESPLTRILEDTTHRPQLQWTDAERRRIYLWLDANVPFYGTYSQGEQLAQRAGRSVPPPRVQ
jgi:hypothetical protein